MKNIRDRNAKDIAVMLAEAAEIERCNNFMEAQETYNKAIKAKVGLADENRELLLIKLQETEFDFFSSKEDMAWVDFLNKSDSQLTEKQNVAISIEISK